MIGLTKIVVSLFPVFLFLLTLIFLDSYRLVSYRVIVWTICIGCGSALICLLIIKGVGRWILLDHSLYPRYGAPVLEEVLKAGYIIFLMKKKKIGFMVDGAIYGFAIGAGFALIENIHYLLLLQSGNLFLWTVRGFGTAVMHGGTTAFLAILYVNLSERQKSEKWIMFLPGLLIAIFIHSFFNHGFLNPMVTMISQIIGFPILITIVFTRSERALRDWLEVGLDSDVQLLEYIMNGNISETKIGTYFLLLKNHIPGDVLADMLCYLRIHLELAIRAKGFLLMKGAGFRVPLDTETMEKFNELEYLDKSIGKTGKLPISPLLNTSTRDLWQLYFLDKQ